MSVDVGIDLGTTFTAAAIARDGRVDMVELGNRANSVPSVVFAEADGTLVVGEAALRRAAGAPARIAREYKRRIGDPTPIIIGEDTFTAEQLTAAMLRWVVELATERAGERPGRLVVAYPANWGEYKRQLLLDAIVEADLAEVSVDILTEPEAAVIHYAAQARVPAGSVIAVYDLGGGTFDAAVVRKTHDGAELLGEPEGIERLGGIDFDEAVFDHVVTALGADMPSLEATDDTVLTAAARLREECVRAKEALSADTEIDIPVMLPGVHTQVRLTRAEFEAMVRTPLNASIGALRRAVRSADLEPADLDAVLLVGGSSRIPLVAEMVGSELGRPVAVDAHPKHAVALGAALTASTTAAAATMAPTTTGPPEGDAAVEQPAEDAAGSPTVVVPVTPAAQPRPAPVAAQPADGPQLEAPGAAMAAVAAPAIGVASGGEPPTAAGAAVSPAAGKPGGRSGPPWLFIAVAVALLAAIAGGVLALRGGDGNGQDVVTGDGTNGSGGNAVVDATATPVPTSTPLPEATASPTAAPTATPVPTATPEPTPSPTPAPVCPPGAERCIEMTQVGFDGDAMVVDWEANGFAPSVGGGFHAHFYWSIFEPQQVGTNFADFGVEQGDWAAVDAQPWSSTNNGMGLSARPAGAEEICVTVGTVTHAVDNPLLFHCLPIPGSDGQ